MRDKKITKTEKSTAGSSPVYPIVMCDYCQKEKTIIEESQIGADSWGWGGPIKITESEASAYQQGLFIDRGYLRLVDLDDCNCLDAGQKIKIAFCPFCGRSLDT